MPVQPVQGECRRKYKEEGEISDAYVLPVFISYNYTLEQCFIVKQKISLFLCTLSLVEQRRRAGGGVEGIFRHTSLALSLGGPFLLRFKAPPSKRMFGFKNRPTAGNCFT